MAPRNPALTFAMRMPCWLTSVGRRGWASVTRFWVCTAAMSALVPLRNVSVMVAEPSEADCEVKYSRLSSPVSCCSMTWVTVVSTVAALAPG
jgi:hypothetical protein